MAQALLPSTVPATALPPRTEAAGVTPPAAPKMIQCRRRAFLSGSMAGGGLCVSGQLLMPEDSAAAGKRRPPPPPTVTEEKKDPNVSGVQAKLLASMKRKEAMKEAMAKLREKAKPVADNQKD